MIRLVRMSGSYGSPGELSAPISYRDNNLQIALEITVRFGSNAEARIFNKPTAKLAIRIFNN